MHVQISLSVKPQACAGLHVIMHVTKNHQVTRHMRVTIDAETSFSVQKSTTKPRDLLSRARALFVSSLMLTAVRVSDSGTRSILYEPEERREREREEKEEGAVDNST